MTIVGDWVTPRGTTLRWASATETGKVRSVNEDSCLARRDAFVVADGMGGHRAGDVASRLTIEAIEALLSGDALTIDALPLIVSAANKLVRDTSVSSDRHGMGSTLVGAFLVDNGGDEEIAVVNVGDSRCYRVDEGRLRQVSRDHSYVQELIDAGSLSREAARRHSERNVITRAIGIDTTVTADYYFLSSDHDYRFMLCSDGLSGEVDDADIEEVLSSAVSPEAAVERLVTAAMSGDASDNITVIVVDVGGLSEKRSMASLDDDGATVRRVAYSVDDTNPGTVVALLDAAPLVVVPHFERADRGSSSRGDESGVIDAVPADPLATTADVTSEQRPPSMLIDSAPGQETRVG